MPVISRLATVIKSFDEKKELDTNRFIKNVTLFPLLSCTYD